MPDFLDEMIAERTAKNPAFPALVEDAAQRRQWGRSLARLREEHGLTQTQLAARMNTAASVISKLEGGADVKLSTIQRYIAAVYQGAPSAQPKPKASTVRQPSNEQRQHAHRAGAQVSASQTRVGFDPAQNPCIQPAMLPAADAWLNHWVSLLQSSPGSAAGPLASLIGDAFTLGERAMLDVVLMRCQKDAAQYKTDGYQHLADVLSLLGARLTRERAQIDGREGERDP